MTRSIDELRVREYWTPPEAARVLGRGCAYWRAAFDSGAVAGYRDGRTRHLQAASARAHLARKAERRAIAAGARFRLAAQAATAAWRRSQHDHTVTGAMR